MCVCVCVYVCVCVQLLLIAIRSVTEIKMKLETAYHHGNLTLVGVVVPRMYVAARYSRTVSSTGKRS